MNWCVSKEEVFVIKHRRKRKKRGSRSEHSEQSCWAFIEQVILEDDSHHEHSLIGAGKENTPVFPFEVGLNGKIIERLSVSRESQWRKRNRNQSCEASRDSLPLASPTLRVCSP